jgi:hypothetical protein
MNDLLVQLIADWKNKGYLVVSGKLWEPGSPFLQRCPEGCHLEIYEKPADWEKISGHNVYRQTRICKVHRFARIYLINKETAEAHNCDPFKP